MGSAAFVQTTFLGGEWSKSAQGIFDHPWYRIALAVVRNYIPIEEASLIRRPSTRQIALTRGGQPAKMLTYFRDGGVDALVLTAGHINILDGRSMLHEEEATIADLSTATPAVLTLDADQNWATDDYIVFISTSDEASADMVAFLGQQIRVDRLTATTYALYDPVTGVALDGSLVTWTSGLSLTVAKIVDIETPYGESEYASTRVVQCEDADILLNGGFAPRVIEEDEGNVFSIDTADFIDGPYLDPIESAWLSPGGLTGLVDFSIVAPTYSTTKAYEIGDLVAYSSVNYRSLTDENLNNQPDTSTSDWAVANIGLVFGPSGPQSSDIGRLIRIFSEPPEWVSATSYSEGNVVKFNGSYWTALTAITGAAAAANSINPTQPGNKATTWAANAKGAIWTWGKITSVAAEGLSGIIDASTGTPIGTLTSGGGLAGAFDGNDDQTTSAAATISGTHTGATSYTRHYIGKDYSASPKRVLYGQLVPSNNRGIFDLTDSNAEEAAVYVKLYASQTLPASSTDGTLLGSEFLGNLDAQYFDTIVVQNDTDTATSWNYVWFEISANPDGNNAGYIMAVAEAQLFTDAPTGFTVQLLGDDLLYSTPVRTWRLGAYSDTTGWPTCGCWHEGRLWLAGAIQNRFDASKSNLPFNFSPTDTTGAVADNNAINYTFNSSERNDIHWLVPQGRGILCGTRGGEWMIRASANDNILTPTSAQAKRVTKNKAADVEPVQPGQSLVFSQLGRRKVMEYLADSYSGDFYASNLSRFSKHLTVGGIEQLAYQEELAPVVWAVTGEGALIGATYRRISMLSTQPPEFIAWHRHDMAREAVSVATINSVNAGLDAVGLITHDVERDLYFIEVLDDLPSEDASVLTTPHLDGGVVPVCATISGATITLRGLHAYAGRSVMVFIAGLNLGEQFVTATGTCVLTFAGTFTSRYLTQISALEEELGDLAVSINEGERVVPMLVGTTYESDVQLLRPMLPVDTGARLGMALGKTRRISQFNVLFHNTQDIQFGTRFDKLKPARFKEPGGQVYSETELFSGVYNDTVDNDHGYDGQLCWRSSGTAPAHILAIGGNIETQG